MYKELFDGLSVTIDGKFMRNGIEKKVTYPYTVIGRKATARVCYNVDKKRKYYQAAKLVAMAWKPKYREGLNIIYKDGDCHNIHADNLIIVGDKQWWDYMQRKSGFHGASIEERKFKLDMIIKEAGLTRKFLENRDFTEINEHVKNRLMPVLEDYCLRTIYIGVSTAKVAVAECIARMYECIDNGMCLYNYERYCKKLLLNYKKKGSFGFTGSVCKPIWNEVEQLNLDCLWEKYKKK